MKIFHKGNTFIATLLNIIGLTFAFTALYIIIVQVHYDLTYNQGIKDSDRVYALMIGDWYEKGKYGSYVNRPNSEEIIREFPLIEVGGLIEPYGTENQIYFNENSDPVPIMNSLATKEGVETVGYELVEGSWKDWTGNAIAVSETTAKKFGVHAGDKVKLGSTDFYSSQTTQEITVAAIYKDMPDNSDFSLHDAINNFEDHNLNNYSEWGYHYFVKFIPGYSEEEINSRFLEFYKKYLIQNKGWSEEKADKWIEDKGYKFIPIKETYFNPIVNSAALKGNKTTTFTLLGVALLIIIIAFINYFNFFFALVPMRLKGVNTRKILGSSRVRLVFSMIAESVGFVIISLGLSAVLVVLFSHSPYASLISTSVSIGQHWGMAFITIGAAVIIATVSSIFPALYITSFDPASGIKGLISTSRGSEYFRNGLIGFQFTISIILVICAIIINQQRHFMLKHDLGFDKENLLTVTVSPKVASKSETVETRLREESDITDVTWADGPIVEEVRMGWVRDFNGQKVSLQVYPVAWNFLRFMNIPIVEGRDYVQSDMENENGLFILNEEAMNKFDFKIGDRYSGHRDDDHPAEVIGFAKDFNYMPLRETGGSFAFYQFGKYPWRPLSQLYVRSIPNADPQEVKEKIINILSETDPERYRSLWDVQLFDTSIENLYVKEKSLSRLINLFTLLAIVISLMGVFGLVMFDTQRRKKEIGIRRVNGASVEEILTMFNMKFIKIVIVSFIIAVPLSWWIISVYLESYAYKTPVYIWVFFVALLAVLIITTGVVTVRSFRAATANPTESLYTE